MSTIIDQSNFVADLGGFNISDYVSAENFEVTTSTTATKAVVYLNDTTSENQGTFDNFSGTIGWAIYADDGDKPSATPIATGSDATPTLTDTGQNLTSLSADIFKVTIDLGSGVSLPPGKYWLAIHEGAWGSTADGSTLYWMTASSGLSPMAKTDRNESNPTNWSTIFAELAFNVLGPNEAPDITDTSSQSVVENSMLVTTVTATDPDDDTLTFEVSGGADSTLFSIDPDTGELTFKAAPDFEIPGDDDGDNVYDIIVKASDGTLFDTQSIAVTVTNVNEAPVITSDGGQSTAVLSLREDRTQVTTVTAEDPDAKTLLTYSLSGGADRGLFDIDPDTGALTFKAPPDFENPTGANGDNTYVVKVMVDDGSVETDSQTLSITVTNGNDRPVITTDGGKLRASVDVAENSTTVTKVQATDQDGSFISYAISGGDDKALFSINATTGKVTFKSAPDFEDPQDKNHDNACQITIRATDSDGAIDVQYLTINVTDVDGVTITGTEGTDKVSANRTVDGQSLPTSEEDHILGLGGNDRLSGLGGDDILEGGAGKDILKGGSGHDHFVYLNVADSTGTGIDRIWDFTQGEDQFALSSIDADGAGGAFHFLGEAGFDGTAGALRQRTAGSDVFLEGDTDGNGVANLVIMLKGSAGLILTNGDLGLGLDV